MQFIDVKTVMWIKANFKFKSYIMLKGCNNQTKNY